LLGTLDLRTDTDGASLKLLLRQPKRLGLLVYLSLGNGLVDAGGQELVAVDPSGIWCDASRFEEALAAGDLEEALSLYRGDLLEGL
jgi:hypothetical protein